MRKWRPDNLLHLAVLLDRDAVRKDILIIRDLRSGRSTGDLDWWEKHLRYDWNQYRHFMGEQETQRRAWLDARAAVQMSKTRQAMEE